jgi:glucosamine-phosphate N-acetyltransferase
MVDNITFHYDDLKKSDYHNGFLQLLEQLTTTGNISYDEFCNRLNETKNEIIVVRVNDKVIATGSILIEHKFIHNLGNVAHIEDIVVDSNYRKYGLGSKILDCLINIATNNNCYKVILDCSDDVVPFYSKNGFTKKGNYMAKYFNPCDFPK